MGRALREIASKVTYHIFTRCRNSLNLMAENEIKNLMITVIEETQKLYEFELNSIEILDDHIHLIIKTLNDEDTISKIMQRIKSVFARRYNKLHGITGPFWNERFGSKIIEKANDILGYFIYLLWYLAYNPVRKKMVTDPRKYKYSSINVYLDEDYKPPLQITIHQFFLYLGKTFKECRLNFLEFEKTYTKISF